MDDIAARACDIGDIHADRAARAFSVEAPHRRVDLEARSLERRLQGRSSRGVDSAGAATAVEDVCRAYTEKRDPAFCHRKRAIILEEDEAFLRNFFGNGCICRKTLRLAAIGRLEVDAVLSSCATILDFVALLPEIGIDDRRILVRIVVADTQGNSTGSDASQPQHRAPRKSAFGLRLLRIRHLMSSLVLMASLMGLQALSC